MSTPDLTLHDAGVPHDLRQPGHAPAREPSTPALTPGVSPSVARVPTAPTLPPFDPSSLAALISRVASEAFAAPPGAPSASGAQAVREPAGLASGASPGQAQSSATSLALPTASQPAHEPAAAPPAPPGYGAARPGHGELSGALFELEPAVPGHYALVQPGDEGQADALYWQRPQAPHDRERPRAIEPGEPAAAPGALEGGELRREFPILEERVNGRRLVWLDNAATTQKPRAVIDRLKYFYEHENSNIHRAAHTLAARSTDAYEAARGRVRRALNAASDDEIIFVRGATEGINLVAQAWGRRNIEAGDEIVITWLEHHANIVPWQQLCAEKGARLRVVPVDDDGQVRLDEYEKLLGPRTKLVSLTQVSNALGTVTPAHAMAHMARSRGVRVLIDGAQSISHMRVDVQQLGCDFFVFSGHKVFGPTGIGAVYGRREVLEAMGPWQGGGNMIKDVTFERTSFQPPPARFEAGTGNIADAVGLGAALEWLERVGIERVSAHEHGLLHHATERLQTVPGLRIIGTAREKAGVVSFVLDGKKTEQMGALLDRRGIAVRSGHHCAQPILRRFGLEATVRASFAPYNTRDDVEALVEALREIQREGR